MVRENPYYFWNLKNTGILHLESKNTTLANENTGILHLESKNTTLGNENTSIFICQQLNINFIQVANITSNQEYKKISLGVK